ncbi:hypothetical protein DSL92_03850 [Billgrantia gudaonensis]|uniref:Uncharacterized protein n=1 Tax=Billgrantia gudaonensis TaxID=376427 RepID=A0A432JJJ3_9GAMM|nr:hypothetical protein DSL92_03850 [Halomonas gudaonensis]
MAENDEVPVLETPWFLRALQAFSGGWPPCSCWVSSPWGWRSSSSSVVSAVLGLAILAVSLWNAAPAPGDFVEHLALAVQPGGQLLVAWNRLRPGRGSPPACGGPCWRCRSYLALAMPSLTHRAFSAFAGLALPGFGRKRCALHRQRPGAARRDRGLAERVSLAGSPAYGRGVWPVAGLAGHAVPGDFGQPLLGGALARLGGIGLDRTVAGRRSGHVSVAAAARLFHHRERDVAPARRIAAYGAVAVLCWPRSRLME